MPAYRWFKGKKTEEGQQDQQGQMDVNALASQVANLLQGQVTNLIQTHVQSQLQPVLLALQALTNARQATPPGDDDDGDGEQQLRQTLAQLTPEQIRALAREEFQTGAKEVTRNYVPKGRVAAQRLFMRNLTKDERELFDKYQDAIEAVIDGTNDELQSNPQTWEKAFDYVMSEHMDEYALVYLKQMNPEDLPPNLQTPVGNGQQTGEGQPAVELNDDEKTMQQIFDRTFKGGFTAEEFKGFSELEFSDIDTMIAKAQAKGLIKNGGTEKANQGNSAKEGQPV